MNLDGNIILVFYQCQAASNQKMIGAVLSGQTNDLILKSKRGDMQAFRLLVEQHQQYAYQLAYRIVQCEEDARDVAQEAFIRVWKHLPRFHTKSKFTTLLYRIVTNGALDKIRQTKRRPETVSYEINDSTIVDSNPDPETHLMNQETMRDIQQAANRLPQKQRLVFILRDLQDLSVKEVAGILKCTQQAVKSHLYFARKKLREMI